MAIEASKGAGTALPKGVGAGGIKDRQFVTALARGLEVLRAFQDCGGPLGNQEIAQRTGLPKPTVSRLTHTLKQLGYIVHDERLAKYRTGPGVLALGQSSPTRRCCGWRARTCRRCARNRA